MMGNPGKSGRDGATGVGGARGLRGPPGLQVRTHQQHHTLVLGPVYKGFNPLLMVSALSIKGYLLINQSEHFG